MDYKSYKMITLPVAKEGMVRFFAEPILENSGGIIRLISADPMRNFGPIWVKRADYDAAIA